MITLVIVSAAATANRKNRSSSSGGGHECRVAVGARVVVENIIIVFSVYNNMMFLIVINRNGQNIYLMYARHNGYIVDVIVIKSSVFCDVTPYSPLRVS
jgi:hypothetical protein